MKTTFKFRAFLILLIAFTFSACDGDKDSPTYNTPTYTVTYEASTADSGAVPIDTTNYEENDTVTVLGNTGNLLKLQDDISLIFADWNTELDGSGTTFETGQMFNMGTEDITLYAMWVLPYVLPTTTTNISLGARSVLVDGNNAYIIAGTEFKVLDVSDPLNPSLLGTVTHGYTDMRVEAQAIHNNIVWCVRSSSGGSGNATYVFGVDVSDPADPYIRGSLTLQTSTSLLSDVSLIYSGYWLVHDYSRNFVYVIDIIDPDAPQEFSSWSVPNMVNGGPGLMMIEGTLLYMPCRENCTFRIYDLDDLAAVVEVGSVGTGTNHEGYGPVKIGEYVYLSAFNWYTKETFIKIIDVSDPVNPVLEGSVDMAKTMMYLKERNGKLFSFEYGSTVSAYSLADPINPVVEASSTVEIPSPSTSLVLYPMYFPAATWVGDYLIGMTWGSAPQYSGARALDFTVN